MNTKFKVIPKSDKPAVDPAKLAAFAAGADAPGGEGQGATPTTPTKTEAPDFDALDNKRRTPRFSMRLTDAEAAKLQHIADTTPDSMHEFCLKALQAAIDAHYK